MKASDSAAPVNFDRAALHAEWLLAAFSRNDTTILRTVPEPTDEVFSAVCMFATIAVKLLADASPGQTEQSVRVKLRGIVDDLLTEPMDGARDA